MVTVEEFLGNESVYAEQQESSAYLPVRAPLDASVLADHLGGVRSIGTYVLQYDKARFMVFDDDTHSLTVARTLAEVATNMGFAPDVEFSGRKGYHVWVRLGQWYPAEDVQRVAKYIADQAGFTGEVFPKQAVARDLGNLVKLPLGKHAVTGEWSKFLREGSVVPGAFEAALAATPVPTPVAKTSFGPLPCLDSIQQNPPGKGERNVLMFHFATHLRRMGLESPQLDAALEALNARVGLNQAELDSIILNSEFSGPVCDQVPSARHCGASCIKQRGKGLSLRPGQLRHAVEGELLVVEAGKQSAVGVIDLVHPDADVAKASLRKTGTP